MLGVYDQWQTPSQAAAGILILQINGFWLRRKILLGSKFLFEASKRGSLQKKTALQNDSTEHPLFLSISIYFVPPSPASWQLRRKEERGSLAVHVLREDVSTIS